MTLHNTIRSILQLILDWAKRWKAYFGYVREYYQMKLDEERLLARLRKEAKEKAKVNK